MRKYLIVLAIIFTSCKQDGKIDEKKHKIISPKKEVSILENDIYDVINSLSGCNWNHPLYYSEYDYSDFRELNSILWDNHKVDSIFTLDDLKFMSKQMKEAQNFKFNIKLFNCKRIIPTDTLKEMIAYNKTEKALWKTLYQKYGKKASICKLGRPLFSLNKQYVIFTRFYLVAPDVNGKAMEVFKKVNEKWELIYSIPLYA